MEYLLRQRPGWLRGYAWFGGSETGAPAIGRQALIALSIRIAAAGLAFAAQIVLARFLGSYAFGVFTYASVWLNVAGSLCAAGFGVSALRFLPAYQAEGETAKARGYIATGRSACLLAGAAGSAVMTGYLLSGGLRQDLGLAPALVLVAVSLPAYALTDFQDGIGRAQNRIASALVPPYILRPVLTLALTVLLISSGLAGGAVAAAAALAMATWFTAAVQLVWQAPKLRRTFPAATGREFAAKLWLSVSLPLLLVDGFALLLTNLDVLILKLWATPDQVGIYYAAIKTISLVAFVHFAITAATSAQLSALYSLGRKRELQALLSEARILSLVPSLICAAPLVVCGKWVLALFGEPFVQGYPAMVIVAVGLLARAAAGPSQNLLMVGGRQNQAAVVLAVAVSINLALCGLLIPGMGFQGAALAAAAGFSFEALASMILARRLLAQTISD
ncbi:MAG: lipopolysaccharide biosynthesis protein [Aestuariivirgaceae bacterium]